MSYQPGTVQVGGCVPHNLSAAQIAAFFDATGLGKLQYIGWALCNGLNGTPDLTDLYIKHSNATAGTASGSFTTSASSAANTGGSGVLTTGHESATYTFTWVAGAAIAADANHHHDLASHDHTMAHTHTAEPPSTTLVYLMRIY